MKIERKREIRSLIRTIPDLVRAGLVQQAFDTEKVIAATFDFSEEFLEKLGGIPQNYIEKIQETYRDILQKSFNTGFKNAEIKLKSTKLNKELVGEELDREIQIKIPMPYGIKTDLVTLTQEELESYLTAVPDKDTILSQFNKDIDIAYLDGAKEYLRQFPNDFESNKSEEKPKDVVVETEEVVIEKEKESTATVATAVSKDVLTALEKYAKLLGTGDAEKVLRYVLGLGDKGVEVDQKEVKASVDSEKEEKEGKEETTLDKSDTLSKLEAYTKLLNNPEAERVLRYTLGLPPKAVTAGLDEEEGNEADKIGSYDVEVLKEKIIDLVSKHKLVEGEDLQTIIVECIESGIGEKDPAEAAKTIATKLELDTTSEDMDEVFGLADDLADNLTDALGLEGTLVFVVTENDDYCLTYSFDAEDLDKHVDEVSVEDKQQLSSLAKLGSSKNLNEIRKASSKVTAHIEAILRNIRNGRVNLVAGSLQLRTNIDDMVYDVFGKSGYKYYKKAVK